MGAEETANGVPATEPDQLVPSPGRGRTQPDTGSRSSPHHAAEPHNAAIVNISPRNRTLVARIRF